VVRVPVRENEEIDRGQAGTQGLKPKLGRRIHLDAQPVHDHVNRGAGALIARIVRGANLAIAREHGHAMRGAGAEKNDLHGDGAKRRADTGVEAMRGSKGKQEIAMGRALGSFIGKRR
jgi:hypothetical protein